MAKIEVTINGTAYPCRPTMGAMLRFKKETGKEVTERCLLLCKGKNFKANHNWSWSAGTAYVMFVIMQR